jgi:RNA recognition motif-containing protein
MTEQTPQEQTVLFVGNLPYSYLDHEFESFIKDLDLTVVSAAVVRDERERSRGFGFARFVSKDDAEAAHAKLNGKELDGRKLRTSFARTDSRYVNLVDA